MEAKAPNYEGMSLEQLRGELHRLAAVLDDAYAKRKAILAIVELREAAEKKVAAMSSVEREAMATELAKAEAKPAGRAEKAA